MKQAKIHLPTAKPTPGKRKLIIVSSILDDWGGSEELWFRSIKGLQAAGLEVVFMRRNLNRMHPRYQELAGMGVHLEELSLPLTFRRFNSLQKTTAMLLRLWYFLMPRATRVLTGRKDVAENPVHGRLGRKIACHKPVLVVISQGINFDGFGYAQVCAKAGFPYVLIAQKAVEFYWPPAGSRQFLARVLQASRTNFFVSEHNKRLTEEQFGMRLPNARVLFNPVIWPKEIFPFPETESGFRLACIGRLFLLDKGQDILIRILAEPQWRTRPLHITFYGTGPDLEGLTSMASLLNVKNITFSGHVTEVYKIWKDCHALVLPSRSEGLPLAVIEAMAAQRPVIVSDAGGNTEVVREGETGFIGHANQESFSSAMERAWNERRNWEQIGKRASMHIRNQIPTAPEQDFVQAITEIVNEG